MPVNYEWIDDDHLTVREKDTTLFTAFGYNAGRAETLRDGWETARAMGRDDIAATLAATFTAITGAAPTVKK